jgi:hypothetical protein
MTARTLVPIAWTLWVLLALGLAYGLVRVLTEPSTSPEAGRGLGVFAIVFLAVLLAVAGVLLRVAARRQSMMGLIAMTVILAYPLVMLVAQPLVMGLKTRSFEREAARTGDFPDASAAAVAAAMRAGDTAALGRLLAAGVPPGKDRAGNDLLAYALVLVRDRQGSATLVERLVRAGADPKVSRPDGMDVVNYIMLGAPPEGREALRLLLERGADPNVPHPATGDTPVRQASVDVEMLELLVEHGADFDRIQPGGVNAVVDYIGTRQWDAALYLIEKGARLDVRNEHGLSVDYYLDSWKESVYGDHPEGWDRVRAAIAKRRATPSA